MGSTFRSLQNRNARLFLFGLLLSNIGTWMQFTAVAILVDRLTGRTTALGILTALMFLPMLFVGAYAGAVADQHDRRKMAMLTQGGMALQAVALLRSQPGETAGFRRAFMQINVYALMITLFLSLGALTAG